MKYIAQGQKPSSFRACFATTEVVPFQIAIYATSSRRKLAGKSRVQRDAEKEKGW
jgi:hypothetical protein